MKKSIIFILLTVLILGVFTACNGDVFADMFNGGSQPGNTKAIIIFNANDGSETPATSTQEVDKNVAAVLSSIEDLEWTAPAGKVFAGWTTKADGSETYYGDKESVTLTEDLTLYAQWGSPLDSGSTTWADGLTYTLENDVSINDRINVNGNVKLFIPNGKTLTASSGITVTGTNSLTINGKGSLSAGSFGTPCPTPVSAAGIGGVDAGISGTVIINGGTVTAIGGSDGGAGIGGGNHGASGTVTINGGTVTAAGGAGAAGIGAGNGSSNHGDLEIGAGVSVTVSDDNANWSSYDGSTRKRYMKANK